jgi:hypothetical protein
VPDGQRCGVGFAVLGVGEGVGAGVGAVGFWVGGSVGYSVGASTGYIVGCALGACVVGAGVGDGVALVGAGVGDGVALVGAGVGARLTKQVRFIGMCLPMCAHFSCGLSGQGLSKCVTGTVLSVNAVASPINLEMAHI